MDAKYTYEDILLLSDEVRIVIDFWMPDLIPSALNYGNSRVQQQENYLFDVTYTESEIRLRCVVSSTLVNDASQECHVSIVIHYVQWVDDWKYNLAQINNKFTELLLERAE
jgi:hypothetical protein